MLNVANNRMLRDGGCDLEAAARRCARAAGFAEEATLQMLKPPHAALAADAADEGAAPCKFEPVFVFRKPAAAPPSRGPRSQPVGLGPDESSAQLDLLL